MQYGELMLAPHRVRETLRMDPSALKTRKCFTSARLRGVLLGPRKRFSYIHYTRAWASKCSLCVKRKVECMLYARSVRHLKLLSGLDQSIAFGLHNV
jgi:hypothetical protein